MRVPVRALTVALLCAAAPAAATHLELCSGTTGSSPCPLPTTPIHATDTLEVAAGNQVRLDQAQSSGFVADSGLVLVQPTGRYDQTGWAWIRMFGVGRVENHGTVTNESFFQPEDDAVWWNAPGGSLTTAADFSIYDDGQLVNDGTVENTGYLYTLIDPANDPPGDPDDPTLDNRGTFLNRPAAQLYNDGWLWNSGTVSNEPGGTFDNTGFVHNSGLILMDGEMFNTVYDAGRARIVNQGDLRVSATGSLDRGSTVKPYGGLWQTAGRIVANGPVSQSPIYVMGGVLEGRAALRGLVRIGDGAGEAAALSPGDSLTAIATLPITGSLALGTDARLVIDAAAGGSSDRVTSTGPDTLGGELALRTQAGTPPAAGDTITVLTASAVRGTFASVTLDGQPAGAGVSVLVEATRVRVAFDAQVSVPGSVAAGGVRLAAAGTARSPELALVLPASARVHLALFDIAGREVRVLHDGVLAAGAHRFAADAPGVASGLWFARARVESDAGVAAVVARVLRVR